MRKIKKVFLYSLMLAAALVMFIKPANVNAEESAKTIIQKAVDELKNAKNISFSNENKMNFTTLDNKETQFFNYKCVGISGNKVDYLSVFEESSYGLDEYVCYISGEKLYYKYGGTNEFVMYKNYNYNKNIPTSKKSLEYDLTHLKNLKITKNSNKYYTLTAKPEFKDSDSSKIVMTVSKKSGRLVKIKFILASGKTLYFRNEEEMFIVTGGSSVYSNISYGEIPVKLPEDVKNTALDGNSNNKEIDFEKVFPSWNKDSKTLQELVDFVNSATDESSPDYLIPEDRIAVFDMDGTILCEKAPVYFDYCLTMYRVLDDPAYDASEDEINSMKQIRDHAYSEGKTFKPEGLKKDDMVASAFSGMTAEEFREYVVKFADNTDVVGFSGMTYGNSFYKPMLEVISYLKNNNFDVWMVSACEREVVRALVERYDIPYDHVIATDVQYVASGKGDLAADDYNMGKEEEILLGAPLDEVECGKSGKSAAIAREIGKRPVLAFGNSSGDYSMLNYAEGNSKHTGMGFFIVCDDTEREYGSDEKAAEYYEEVEKNGWTAVSMANDWKTIYGDDVKKTELPGVVEEVKDAA